MIVKLHSMIEERKTIDAKLAHLEAINNEIKRDLHDLMHLSEYNVPIHHRVESSSNSCVSSFPALDAMPKLNRRASEPNEGIQKSSDTTLSRLLLLSVEDAFSPLKKTVLGVKAFEPSQLEPSQLESSEQSVSAKITSSDLIITPPVSTILPSLSPSHVALSASKSKKPLPFQGPSYSSQEVEIMNEFLKIELGNLYQPNLFFANLNLFQIRHGRKLKENSSIFVFVFVFYLVTIELLQQTIKHLKNDQAYFQSRVKQLESEADQVLKIKEENIGLQFHVTEWQNLMNGLRACRDNHPLISSDTSDFLTLVQHLASTHSPP